MSSSQPSCTDSYALGRDYTAASRLNYQYYLWKETLGHDLHPSIPLSPTPAETFLIADVGCGSGIWLRSVAQALPRAQLDGFDISLAQCPPLQWLPRNVSLRQWDLFSEPPAELRGRYDVVHVRLIFVVVQEEDPRPVITNLRLLLKPGGYLQWDELDVAGSYILKANEEVQATEMEGMLQLLNRRGGWVGKLERFMSECGLLEARRWEYEERKELARAFFDNHLAKDAEMAETSLRGTLEGKALAKRIRGMYEESKGGAVLCTPKVVCVGRRAAEEGGMPDLWCSAGRAAFTGPPIAKKEA